MQLFNAKTEPSIKRRRSDNAPFCPTLVKKLSLNRPFVSASLPTPQCRRHRRRSPRCRPRPSCRCCCCRCSPHCSPTRSSIIIKTGRLSARPTLAPSDRPSDRPTATARGEGSIGVAVLAHVGPTTHHNIRAGRVHNQPTNQYLEK